MDDSILEIHRSGHRAFIGGAGPAWDTISELQFNHLVSRGLSPSDRFVDIGCGSLRGGSRFIEYLDAGNYHGIDKFIELIIYGVNAEVSIDTYKRKMPKFVVSDSFEFEKFQARFTFAIAQSLFTHLNRRDITDCLFKLADVADPGCRAFVTFFECEQSRSNPEHSHSHAGFAYTRHEMETFGEATGWVPHYIGAWNHPRNQHIIEYLRPS